MPPCDPCMEDMRFNDNHPSKTMQQEQYCSQDYWAHCVTQCAQHSSICWIMRGSLGIVCRVRLQQVQPLLKAVAVLTILTRQEDKGRKRGCTCLLILQSKN